MCTGGHALVAVCLQASPARSWSMQLASLLQEHNLQELVEALGLKDTGK